MPSSSRQIYQAHQDTEYLPAEEPIDREEYPEINVTIIRDRSMLRVKFSAPRNFKTQMF